MRHHAVLIAFNHRGGLLSLQNKFVISRRGAEEALSKGTAQPSGLLTFRTNAANMPDWLRRRE
jgi:hypothetical protein